MPKRRDLLLGIPLLALAGDDPETIYIPEHHAEKDRAFILDFLEEYSFAMLVTSANGLRATNVPTLLDRSPDGWGKLWWHIARNNPQNLAFDGEKECLGVFHGPHGYISPNWYRGTGGAVPTWNFAVVHVTGRPRRVEGDEALAQSLKRLVERNEARYGGGDSWDYGKLPPGYLKGMRQNIVPYEMTIERVEAKFKLGQERSAADREDILKGLEGGRSARNLADLSRAYYRRKAK